jgi:outer membrane protein TolC
VADVLSDLGVDDANIAGHPRALALAEANVRDAENAYRLGGGTLMQLVDAQRILSRARRAMVQTEAQRYSDLVALYAATAADWRAAP